MDRKEIRRQRTKLWIKNNPERRKKQLEDRYERHKVAGTLDVYYGKRDLVRNRERAKAWREQNKGRVAATLAKRRADRHQATPKWAELDEIRKLYNKAAQVTESTGIEHEVDHIVPLVSDIVCGLHCMDNLQIMTADANNRKKCKILEV